MRPHAYIPNMGPATYMHPCEQEGCGEIFDHPNHRGRNEEDFARRQAEAWERCGPR